MTNDTVLGVMLTLTLAVGMMIGYFMGRQAAYEELRKAFVRVRFRITG